MTTYHRIDAPPVNRAAVFRPSWLLLLVVLCAASAWAQGPDVPDYRLASGDRIKVTVFGHDDLSGEFEIDGSGEISMPLIREVKAAGLTVGELEETISDALQPDYLKHPRVSVEVLNYRPYYIIGEVTSPGKYPYASGLTVVNAVAVAGGFTYRAKKSRIRIKRTVGDQAIEIEAQLNTPVLPGDVIEIPERFF